MRYTIMIAIATNVNAAASGVFDADLRVDLLSEVELRAAEHRRQDEVAEGGET